MTSGYSNNNRINHGDVKYNRERRISGSNNVNLRCVNQRSQYEDVRANTGITGGDYIADAIRNTADYVGEKVLENRRRKMHQRANMPVIVKKKIKSTPFPVSFVFYAIIVTVTLMYIVYNYSVINDMSYETTRLENEINEQLKEKRILSVALDQKNDLTYIEEVATNKLGMVKSTDIVKRYVSISGEDKVVVSEENTSKVNTGLRLDGLKDIVGSIFE